ncbi:MAG: hypothetical protein WC867_01945 [Candidatus Pacearchaeota archaeon]|jgi:hypothetical protein
MATKKCEICKQEIDEDYGKLKGTIVRTLNEKKIREFKFVCSICQKEDGWLEKAKNQS